MRRLPSDVVRLFLALAFLHYGAAKLADQQFAYGRTLGERTVGELDGMSLVWAYFARSRPSQVCVGLAELAAALLLLARRTAALGAVAYLPVILNVVLVDLCFGVQREATLFALLLLAGNAALLVAERHRLARAAACLLARADAPAKSWAGVGLAALRWVGALALAWGLTLAALWWLQG